MGKPLPPRPVTPHERLSAALLLRAGARDYRRRVSTPVTAEIVAKLRCERKSFRHGGEGIALMRSDFGAKYRSQDIGETIA